MSPLPLFPLHTVLFPGGALALRIFETRYVDMVRQCMRDASPFGVVLIRAGAEVGLVADTADIGTTARIADFNTLPGGLLGLMCMGERKFRVSSRWQQNDGLNLGDIELLPAERSAEVPDEHRHLVELLRKLLPELAAARGCDVYDKATENFADASWVGSRLGEVLPLSLPDRFALLEMDDPVARLEKLSTMVQRVAG